MPISNNIIITYINQKYYIMENNTYTFDLNPTIHQPTGCCDFSKIYNPKTAIVTYKNLDTNKTECHNVKRTEIVDNNDIKIYIYFTRSFYKKDGV